MTTFLHVVELLLTNDDAKASYAADPDGFLTEHGLGDLDSADVADAMLYATDSLPLSVATQLDPEAGLESAAALDMDAAGLSLERDAVDGGEAADLGDDVQFDHLVDEADPVDGFDAGDAGDPMGGGVAAATASTGEFVAGEADISPDDMSTDAFDEIDDPAGLTDLDAIVDPVAHDDHLDDGALGDVDDLEVEALNDVDPGDLDFLE